MSSRLTANFEVLHLWL